MEQILTNIHDLLNQYHHLYHLNNNPSSSSSSKESNIDDKEENKMNEKEENKMVVYIATDEKSTQFFEPILSNSSNFHIYFLSNFSSKINLPSINQNYIGERR